MKNNNLNSETIIIIELIKTILANNGLKQTSLQLIRDIIVSERGNKYDKKFRK